MNINELGYFSDRERQQHDVTSMNLLVCLKSLFIKMRRKTWGRFADRSARLVWTVDMVSDACGPADNVHNYNERMVIRSILSGVNKERPIRTACEVGAGYGRLIMVLSELAEKVVGFEREDHLAAIARKLLPKIRFHTVRSLDAVSSADKGPFDLAMTCTVLQHLTDGFCGAVIDDIKRICPRGYVLLIEKTQPISISKNVVNGDAFISGNAAWKSMRA